MNLISICILQTIYYCDCVGFCWEHKREQNWYSMETTISETLSYVGAFDWINVLFINIISLLGQSCKLKSHYVCVFPTLQMVRCQL